MTKKATTITILAVAAAMLVAALALLIVWFRRRSGSAIAAVAKKHIGLTEKPGNAGFNNPQFEAEMRGVGWQTGQAWCAYLGKLIIKKAVPDLFSRLQNHLTGGSVDTANRIARDFPGAIVSVPAVGGVVIWKTAGAGTGHYGIVVSVNRAAKTVTCVEGNTTEGGGREGYAVLEKTSSYISPRGALEPYKFIDLNKI